MKTTLISRYVCVRIRVLVRFFRWVRDATGRMGMRFRMRVDLLRENRDPKSHIVGIHLSVHVS